MLSHTRMGVPYEYTYMGRPIRVWANIRIWGRTWLLETSGVQRLHLREFCVRERFCILLKVKKSMALFRSYQTFFISCYLGYF